MNTIIYSKHSAQLWRKPFNLSKSIKLDIKKHCNRSIKRIEKDPKMSSGTKTRLIKFYQDTKKSLVKS